jgi:Uma2 family endonuclease
LFHNVCDAGVFEGRNVILVNGEILEMPPPNPLHNTGLVLIENWIRDVFRTGYVVRNQMALDLSRDTDPVPDLAVVSGVPRDYISRQPTTAVLAIEVSDSTLAYDRGEKANLYAASGIADYWVLDLVNRQLLVFRDPRPDPAQPHGFAYATQLTFGPADSVEPLAAPGRRVAVAELLP